MKHALEGGEHRGAVFDRCTRCGLTGVTRDGTCSPPFPRPACGMTVDEIRDALERVSGECRATAAELHGEDAAIVGRMLRAVAEHAESAHALMRVIEQGRRDLQ